MQVHKPLNVDHISKLALYLKCTFVCHVNKYFLTVLLYFFFIYLFYSLDKCIVTYIAVLLER